MTSRDRPPIRRRRVRALVGLLCGCLLCACGLPLPAGVQQPGEVSADPRLPEPIEVLPPGPQPGASPEEVVLGFLAAQSSGKDEHGIARSFLAPAARAGWHDDAGVTVYDPRTASTSRPQPDGDATIVTLALDVLGAVGADGAARAQAPQQQVQRYRLRQDTAGQWQLIGVPAGLTLSTAARDRSYDAVSVHFLAPMGPPPATRHLVADLLQLPADGARESQLMTKLLAGPSSALAGSVESAVAAGTRLRSASTLATGEVTVDLTGPADAMSASTRQDLSAQIVWTLREGLPDFTRLLLLVDGKPLPVPGVGEPQPRGAWGSYAPDGPAERPPAMALVDGQLRSLQPADEDRGPSPLSDVADVADVAVDPRAARLAVLTGNGTTRTLRTGPLAGPLDAQPVSDPGLRSPTWGSGELGLWLLRTGSRPAVLLAGRQDAAPVEVLVDGLPALDGNAVLRVSRDGARVALVAGKVLYVGRIERDRPTPHVVALRRLATGVLDVAWQTGTYLQVLVEDTEPPLLPLLRLSIDGTAATRSGLVGVAEGDPVSLTAYADQPLLVETRTGGSSTVYSAAAAAAFEVRLRDASRPAYPR